MSPSPGCVLQFLAPSGPEEPAVRSEGHFQPDPTPREQAEVYPEAGTWDLVMAGVVTALLGGGVLFLLLRVSGGRCKSPLPAAEIPLLKGWGIPLFSCPCGTSSSVGVVMSRAALCWLVPARGNEPRGCAAFCQLGEDRRCTHCLRLCLRLCRALPMPRLCSGLRS